LNMTELFYPPTETDEIRAANVGHVVIDLTVAEASGNQGDVELFVPQQKPIEAKAAEAPAEEQAPKEKKQIDRVSLVGKIVKFDKHEYKNGALHIRGFDAEGNKYHLGTDNILKYYGHEGEYQGKNPDASKTRKSRDMHFTTGHQAELANLVGEDREDVFVHDYDSALSTEEDSDLEALFMNEQVDDHSPESETALIADFESLSAPHKHRYIGKHRKESRGFIGALKTLPAAAYIALGNLDNRFRVSKEKGWTPRRKALGFAIGAVAATGVAVLIYKYGQSGHHHATEVVPGNNGHGHGGNPVPATPHIPNPNNAHGHETALIEGLHKGSTVSDQVNEQLKHMGVHYNDHQLYAVVTKTLHHNHLTYPEAHHLPIGFQTHLLHPEQIKQILEQSKS